MRIRFAAAVAAVTLTALALTMPLASGRSTPARGTSSNSGASASSQSKNTARGIFDIATSSQKPSGSQSSAGQNRTATASPFGTPSPNKASDRRWKAACKIADCVQNRAIPPNANLTLSGKVTDIASDGRFTIVKMFDSVSVKLDSGAQADVPVRFSVVLDAETASGMSIKVDNKKSFTMDSNYVYMVWDDDGCCVRAVHNGLTEQDDSPASAKR